MVIVYISISPVLRDTGGEMFQWLVAAQVAQTFGLRSHVTDIGPKYLYSVSTTGTFEDPTAAVAGSGSVSCHLPRIAN